MLLLPNSINRKAYKVKFRNNCMINFLEHLEKEEDTLRAASAWISSLKEKGLVVKASAIPKLLGFRGDIGKLIGPYFTDAEEVINEIYTAGLAIRCDSLKQEPYIKAIHLDHNQTLARLKNLGNIVSGNSFKEAIQYLSQLKQYGVNLAPGQWNDVLADEHKEVMNTPLKEIELCAASGRFIPRCVPGWTEIHAKYAKYRLVGEWNDNVFLRKIIEDYYMQGRFNFTDGICNQCMQEL